MWNIRFNTCNSIGNGSIAGKKLGNQVRLQFHRAGYEISEAISGRMRVGEWPWNGTQRRERERRAGAGFSPRVKEIIGDTGPRPSLRRPYEIAILSNPPRVLPASGKCPHISMPTVMDIVERRWVVPAPQLVSNYRNWDWTRVRGWKKEERRGEERRDLSGLYDGPFRRR